MSEPPDTYVHGHHESVLRSHSARTAENSAAYLLPHLTAGQRVLDVGCGPGTITADLARAVAPGEVIGIDAASDVIAAARQGVPPEGVSLTFAVGDVYALDHPDDSFDVVHAHQLLQHLREPVAALEEMRRVLRPGGILAVRDADYGGMHWAPDDPRLDRWMALYQEMTDRNGVEANAGRYLLGWVQRAGFRDAMATSSSWTFADPTSRAWWGGLWAQRVVGSAYAEQVLAHGLAEPGELEDIGVAFREWAAAPDGFFVCPNAEVLARE